MDEPRQLWTFPDGMVGHADSVKGYTVVATDGPLGECSWADYAPGESYLVVTHKRKLGKDEHYLVPAGAVTAVHHENKTVTINVTGDEVRGTPPFDDPQTAYDSNTVDQFARGMLGGGFVWPYTDV
jgi:hypothetical protein